MLILALVSDFNHAAALAPCGDSKVDLIYNLVVNFESTFLI